MTLPLNNFDEDTTCNLQLATSILPCDAYHHYYHYQSSAQYLWLAETLQVLGKEQEAIAAYDKALFQDHFNQQAIDGKKRIASHESHDELAPLQYKKQPLYDTEFCISIGETPNTYTVLHDKAVEAYLAGDHNKALSLLLSDTEHSNSRFLIGKCRFALGQYEEACAEFTEAIRLSHIRHDAYHRFASVQHFLRGNEWLEKGELELAINDFTKALDLHGQNKEAKRARALAYKAKGNLRLAMEDGVS